MAQSHNADRRRTANILGAFALALTDKMTAAVRDAAGHGDMASAAIVQIGSEPGLSIERLRLCLALSHSATVRLVDAIQAAGLVTRERNSARDSRVAILTLTPAGRAHMRAILAARSAIIEPVLARLSAGELSALVAILEKATPAVVASGPDQDVVCRLCDLHACPQHRCPVMHLNERA